MKVPLQLSILYCISKMHLSKEDCESPNKVRQTWLLGFFIWFEFTLISEFQMSAAILHVDRQLDL